jgi:hypothetical protein
MPTHTFTKTFAIYGAWAETFPWDCVNPAHDHGPMVNDPCAEPQCDERLLADEVCYAVTQIDGYEGPPPRNPGGKVRRRESWVCWRHVHPDDGPRRVPR